MKKTKNNAEQKRKIIVQKFSHKNILVNCFSNVLFISLKISVILLDLFDALFDDILLCLEEFC